MRLLFLGTSAGELYPGIWCRCRNCEAARQAGGKNIRQSAALYVSWEASAAGDAGGLLIDFPSEIVSQAWRHGVDLTRLETLLVTHSHGDHWFPYLLRWRGRPHEITEVPTVERGAPRFTALPTLQIYGNAAVEAVLKRELGEDLAFYDIDFHRLAPGDSFRIGAMQVDTLAANHDVGREEAVHYLLTPPEGTVLYGLDGDTFLPATRQALQARRLDAVILESTYGFGDGGNHRNFARLGADVTWMRDAGILKPHARVIATHFSPHHCPPHAETAAYLAQWGIKAAWDGCVVEVGR